MIMCLYNHPNTISEIRISAVSNSRTSRGHTSRWLHTIFCQGGKIGLGGDNSKRGTVFIYILMFSVHVQ